MFFTFAEPSGGSALCVHVILLHKTSFFQGFLVKLTVNTLIQSSPSLCYSIYFRLLWNLGSLCLDNGGRLSVLSIYFIFYFFWHPGLADICHRPDNEFLISSMKEAGRAFCGMWTRGTTQTGWQTEREPERKVNTTSITICPTWIQEIISWGRRCGMGFAFSNALTSFFRPGLEIDRQ